MNASKVTLRPWRLRAAYKGLCAGRGAALCDSITTAQTENWCSNCGGGEAGAASIADAGHHSDTLVTVKDISDESPVCHCFCT